MYVPRQAKEEGKWFLSKACRTMKTERHFNHIEAFISYVQKFETEEDPVLLHVLLTSCLAYVTMLQ